MQWLVTLFLTSDNESKEGENFGRAIPRISTSACNRIHTTFYTFNTRHVKTSDFLNLVGTLNTFLNL